MLNETWIKAQITNNEYVYSQHGDGERQNDNLLLEEVEQALLQGQIIEQYNDTGRGESCLMAGFTRAGKPIHIVCGKSEDRLVIVTVYIPKPPKFKTPYIRGK